MSWLAVEDIRNNLAILRLIYVSVEGYSKVK